MKTVHLIFRSGESCTIDATDGLDINSVCALLSPLGVQQIVVAVPEELSRVPEEDDDCPCPVCQRTRLTH